jgi:hypothetical protein
MTVARSTFHIASVENGESAVSYEVALDTNSITANGETGKFLTTNLGRFRFIKHIGGNSKEQNGVYDTFDYLMVFIGYDGKCLKYSDGGYYYSTNEGIDNIYSSMEVNDVAEEKVKLIKIFWYDGPVYADDNHNYIDSLCENLGVPAENIPLEILASNTFTVVRDGKKGDHGIAGARGSSGPVWRQHVGFVSATADAPYQYYAGSNDERFLDVVLINKVWYRCLQSYRSTGTDDIRNTMTNAEFAKYWTSADMSNFTFIATQFLLAENAKINLFGSNEINLYGSDAEGKIFASFRVPNGNGDDSLYALWIGAETGATAPYSVTKAGHMKGTDVDLSGKITAISGAIGNFVIADGSIKFVSPTKTCEICTNYVQYVDVSSNQTLFSGFDDGGLKVELSGKDNDNGDMACRLVVTQDSLLNRKQVGLVTKMTGYKAKFAPNELYMGDYFSRAIMTLFYDGSNSAIIRFPVPKVGIGSYIDVGQNTLRLILRGLRASSGGYHGEVYEENGYLKIYKG